MHIVHSSSSASNLQQAARANPIKSHLSTLSAGVQTSAYLYYATLYLILHMH